MSTKKEILAQLYSLCEKFDLFYDKKPENFDSAIEKIVDFWGVADQKISLLAISELEDMFPLRFMNFADWFYATDVYYDIEKKLDLTETFKIKTYKETHVEITASNEVQQAEVVCDNLQPDRIPVSIVIASINEYLKSINYPKTILEIYDLGTEDYAAYVAINTKDQEDFKTEFLKIVYKSSDSMLFSTQTQKTLKSNLVIE